MQSFRYFKMHQALRDTDFILSTVYTSLEAQV